MNSVYPPNHFSSSYPAGAGGAMPAGFPISARAGLPMDPTLAAGAGGGRLMNMTMVSRLSDAGPGGRAGDVEPKACAGCGGRIVERVMLHSMDRFWHESCLKCNCCGRPLADSSSCFIRSGMILCKNDYMRLFGSCGQCGGCGQNIPPSELVMRVGASIVYHIRCFCCSKCSAALSRGDRYLLVNGLPVCEHDANKLFQQAAPATVVKKGKVGRPRRQRD